MDVEIKLTKNELRKISSDFRMYANRLMHTSIDDGMKNLKRFLNFINTDLVISDFLQKNSTKQFDIQSICHFHTSGVGYSIPDDSPEDEINFTYQILQYGLEKFSDNSDGYWHLAATKETYFGGMKKIVDNFNHTLVKPFIYYIENYLTQLQIDLGDDENAKLTIHFHGNNYGHNIGAKMTETNINQSNSSIGVGVNQGEINAEKLAGTINEADKRNIAEVAAEIQQLLEQLEQSYPTNTNE